MATPTGTYRIQFRNGMTFERAAGLVPYLKRLGISHLYASPIFTSTRGSSHGYDITDANEIDPSIGGRKGFERMVDTLRAAGLGLILDIVPNHMAASLENMWWRDVVENGEKSQYARHFDIDWSRKLTLPFLADTFEEVLAAGKVSVRQDPETTRPAIVYDQTFYPLNKSTYLGREAEVMTLTDKAAIAGLHDQQPYRLMSWRDAPHALSYRRFFEITGLVGMRVEEAEVFEDTHRLILELVYSGAVDGLRIDHVDGLADPKAYLERLREKAGDDCYIVVEKILGEGEHVPLNWPVSGTTGYEFIAAVSHAMVDDTKLDELRSAYQAVIGAPIDVEGELRAIKQQLLDHNFAIEVDILLKLAGEIAEAEDCQSIVAEARLRSALRELLVSFPVYRTYGNLCGLPAEGRQVLSSVLANVPGDASSTAIDELAFLVRILTGDVSEASASQAVTFRSRFQQLTGPLMAKSVEDTLFFRQHMALALNEVGASPLTRRFSLSRFHEEMQLRLERQPDGLSSTSTHDTKRGEDGRARLYSISEAPGVWAEAVSRWRDMNGSFVEMLDDGAAPEPEVEWMLYQALAGAWPANLHPDHAKDLSALETRFVQYVEKALREAKLRTNWVAHNDAYERAVIRYARRLVSRDNPLFLIDFTDRLQSFARAGRTNSISQTVIKLMAPGVPDIYQGSEGLDFSLVDPDNRREPDFGMLQTLLAMDPPDFNDDEDWSSGRVKQHVIARLLRLRGDMPGLFSRGSYIPLRAQGKRSDGLIAFTRANATDAVIVLVARLSLSSGNTPLSSHWQGVTVRLPDILVDRPFFEVFAGRRVQLERDLDVGSAALRRSFAVYRST